MHASIYIRNLSYSFTHTVCLENISASISYGQRIAIIGRNGSGKSTLLKILAGLIPQEGIILPKDVDCLYIPQALKQATLSGGEGFNQALEKGLRHQPNLLLLDEPTNHLDSNHRRRLMKVLCDFQGTLVVATHDEDVLKTYFDRIWFLNKGVLQVFKSYTHYKNEKAQESVNLEKQLRELTLQKKEVHEALMKEQQRAFKSKRVGRDNCRKKKYPSLVAQTKARQAQETTAQRKKTMDEKRHSLSCQLADLHQPKAITPRFSLTTLPKSRSLITIQEGMVGYANHIILKDIYLSLGPTERIAIQGSNGSGKSTFVKALLGRNDVERTGQWQAPFCIGYLDQFYENLDPHQTVIESFSLQVPTWSYKEKRSHLNDFFFQKNEAVSALVSTLSEGEKARLSLAHIAAQTPPLLVLDEITNNLDDETKHHVITVLRAYPGALILISHDQAFLKAVNVQTYYTIEKFCLKKV